MRDDERLSGTVSTDAGPEPPVRDVLRHHEAEGVGFEPTMGVTP